MAELQKQQRFILARASEWSNKDKSLYNDSIVFIHNGSSNETPGKCVAIYTKGVEYPVGKALSGETITKAFAGNGTVSYTTTGTKLDGTSANITALSFKQGDNITITVDESGALVITGKDWKTEIETAVAGKNVSAEGDDYVSATANGNKVTVTATQEIIDAVGYADSALQNVSASGSDYVTASFDTKTGNNGAKSQALTVDLSESTKTSLALADTAVQTIETGETNGTIKVDGKEVAVAGLGSAAYTESTAYDAAGAASTVKTELLGGAAEGTTLKSLSDAIADVSADAKSYSIAKVESGLGENVKEAFKLVDEDGTQVGETINIYKDSSLVSIELVDADKDGNNGQFLKYVYVLANGNQETVYVDANKFLVQSEFKNGLQVSDAGEVSVKVDEESENFLTVSEKGVKVSGIADAISTAVNAKNVSAEGDEYVTASADDNKVTVAAVTGSVSNNDDKLAICSDVKTYVDGKFDALDATLTADTKAGSITTGYANVITGINQVDGLVSISATTSLPTGEEIARQAAKATTKVVKSTDNESAKYLDVTSIENEDESTTYTVKVSGIDTAISDAIGGLDSNIDVDATSVITSNNAHNGKVYESIEIVDGKLVQGENTQTRIKYIDNAQLTNSTLTGIKYIGISNIDTISQAFEKCESAWDWGTI